MNRRGFLRALGLGGLAAAATPLLPKLFPESDADYYRRMRSIIPVEKRVDEIGGWVSYRYHMTVTLPPSRTQRIRFIEAVSNVS